MRYINKANASLANAILDQLLTDSWNEEENKYFGANYDGLCRIEYRQPFVEILLQEQDNLCCYCQKIISYHNTTLEHIIPHNSSAVGFQSYQHQNFSTLDHKENFDYNTNLIPPHLYPHDIAYFNLSASCNSNGSCNHFRGDNFIFPLFYDANVGHLVVYDYEGRAYSEQYNDELDILGISTNSHLRVIRKICYLIASNNTNLSQITTTDVNLLASNFLDDDLELFLNNYFDNPHNVENLKNFVWFVNYYT